MVRLSKYERETIVCFNEEEPLATVYTTSKKIKTKLDKMLVKNPSFKLKSEDAYSKVYQLPKELISFRNSRKISKVSD